MKSILFPILHMSYAIENQEQPFFSSSLNYRNTSLVVQLYIGTIIATILELSIESL
jgi:hypothetical protein